MGLNTRLIMHVLFITGYMIALLGSFEQALDAGNDPIFSSVFGYPILHHYLIGFIIVLISYLSLTIQDWIISHHFRKVNRSQKDN